MNSLQDISGYVYTDEETNSSHSYLVPALLSELKRLERGMPISDKRLFDLGCGNGSIGQILLDQGWSVTGVDPSEQGIEFAKMRNPKLHFAQGSAYDDLAASFGNFPVVISLEVVEHLYSPRKFARTLFDLVEPGGTAIVSTPYHGYLKNLTLAITGKMDAHFTALWDHGHIKFWSVPTLSSLLTEAGFERIRFLRVGRVPPLAKSMIAIAERR